MGIMFKGKAKDFERFIKFLEYGMGLYGKTIKEVNEELEFRKWMSEKLDRGKK